MSFSPLDLQYFVVVADTENLSRAAERIGIAQPSLSVAIQRLERQLSTKLLNRTGSGVRLTRAGERLLRESKSLLLQWNQIKSSVSQSEDEVSGVYRIGAHPSVAIYSLGRLAPLLKTYPMLQLEFVHDLSRVLCEKIISHKIDIGIVVNPIENSELVIKKLTRDEVTFFTRKKPTVLQQMNSNQSTLICDPHLMQSQNLLKRIKRSQMMFERILPCTNLEVICEMVGQGLGCGILPSLVAARNSSLKPMSKAPVFHDDVCLVYRSENRSQPGIQVIRDALSVDWGR